jgi:hypothetical protein
MVQIVPFQATTSGPLATQLSVLSTDDDLYASANFRWVLFDVIGQVVNNGLIPCEGEDYLAWDGNNVYPYSFVAGILGVEIIGNVQ